MTSDNMYLTACHEFIVSHLAQITKIVQLMLNVGNCIDPGGHTGEVVNQVYIRVREKWNSLRSPEKVLNMLAANLARNHAHKCRRESPQEIYEGVIPWLASGPHDPTNIYEQAILIEQLLDQLEESDQLLISLLFEGWTYEEIAVTLDTLSSTLRTRYARAVQKLKQDNSDALRQEPIVAITD
jgi:RNA polymerase sigma factor (sigma-70 family)